MIFSNFSRGYFTFFLVVTIVASLNDYWKKLKLDVLFADTVKANKNGEEDEKDAQEQEETAADTNNNNIQTKGIQFYWCASKEYYVNCIFYFYFWCDVILGAINQILMGFSVKQTGSVLFTFEENDETEQIVFMHGLKGLATIFLYFSFKFMTNGHLPITNRAYLTEVNWQKIAYTPRCIKILETSRLMVGQASGQVCL